MRRELMELTANRCWLELRQMGITLSVIDDMDRVIELYKKMDKSLSPASDPHNLMMTRYNSFSVFGFEGGEPVIGFFVRMDDLVDEDAQSFLPGSLKTIFDVSVTSVTSEVYKGRTWGRVGYFGDLKTVKRPGIGSKGEKVLRLASAYAHYRAFKDLGTNMHYSFLRDIDYRNAVPYGFLELGPYVWKTDKDLYADGSPKFIGLLGADKLPDLMAMMLDVLPELLDVDQEPVLRVINNSTGTL